MIVDKTKLGISFFDETFGGVYRGRQVLCSGRRGSGKSILACHFLNQGLLDGDKALLLSNYRAQDTIIVAESLGLPFAKAVTEGQLTILEYASFIPESTASSNLMLPPQSFMELQETVESQSIRRLAFDTALPWVAIHPVTRIAEHVYSFIHAIERLGVTALLTIPKPVSNPSFSLKSRLEDLCPVAVNVDHENGANRVLRVTKYLGEVKNLSTPFPFVITPNKGIISEAEAQAMAAQDPARTAPADHAAPSHTAQTLPPAAPEPAPAAVAARTPNKKPINFSSVIRFPE
ncbi:MAG: RAD55 family ATPase [Kiritimatiellae bacterium]|nr:RAD55 family ATPase [Kiritimatiellia bacterium]